MGDGPESQPVVLPSDPKSRVAALIVAGGFVPPGWNEATAPRLAVYADGTAIAGAAHQLALSGSETTELVAALRRDLSGLPASPQPVEPNFVADAGTTMLFVLGAQGKPIEVSAYALDILKYEARVMSAHERLQDLAERIAETGKPYTAQRIRLVAVPQPDAKTSMGWPDVVPVPKGTMVRVSDLDGPVAQAAVAAFPRKPDGPWEVYDAGAAGNLAVTWRYLLPDE